LFSDIDGSATGATGTPLGRSPADNLDRRIRMTIRKSMLLTAAAAFALGAAACTQAEQEKTEAHAEAAADNTAEAASQAGEVIESGAMKAAQAVESGAGKVADKLEENQAEAAAEGRPGAVDPATDRRVPDEN
jgi:hypothetical protein